MPLEITNDKFEIEGEGPDDDIIVSVSSYKGSLDSPNLQKGKKLTVLMEDDSSKSKKPVSIDFKTPASKARSNVKSNMSHYSQKRNGAGLLSPSINDSKSKRE